MSALDSRIRLYPDEPHPDDEHAWKSWWVRKMFKPEQMLTTECLFWIDRCWKWTKANWHNAVKP